MSFATPAQAAAPEFSTSTTTRSIAENTPADTDVGDVIPEATDADNDDLTYSMEGTDAASFNFNATTRQITTKAGVDYDYETQPTWSVTVKADDGNGGTDIIAVTINLTNLPAVSIAPRQKRVLLSDGQVYFEFTSDVRPTGDLSVPLAAVQDQPWIEVAHLSLGYGFFLEGWIPTFYDFKADAPAQGGNFTVTLQPGAGYELGTKTATVEVVAADPLITVSAAQASYSSAESAGTQTVTLRAQTIAGAPRPLAADTAHDFTWTATADTATGGGTDFRDASGTVTFIRANFIKQGGRWVASREVQVALVDDSASEPDEQFHVTLARHSSLHRLVKLANADGTLCENNAPGVNCGATITITDNDGGNDPPAFDADSDTRSIVENSAADTDVGDPVTATDSDNDTLTYSLEGAHAGSFTIDASSGQIKTKSGVDYDYETRPTWSVTVKADDGNGGTDIIAVTINLTNLLAVSIAPRQKRVLLSDGQVYFEFTSDVRPTGDLSVPLAAVQDQPWIEVAHLSLGYGFFLEGWIPTFYDFKADAPAQGGNFTVTLQPGAGYELGTKTATVEVVAADPLITVSAAQASYSSAESAGTQTVTLRAQTIAGAPRPLAADTAHDFTWTATADTATGGGTDFRDAGGRVTFIRADFTEKGGRWVASEEVQVALVDDSASEPDERFHVTLARHSTLHRLVKLANADGTLCENNAPGVNCGATITIRDDEPPAVGFVGATTVSEGEGTYTARVALNHAGTETFTVDYRSRDASATAGQDYTAVSGTLTFAPGESEKTFAVPILNDTLVERERFELVLSGVDTSKAVLDPDTSSIAVDIEDDGDTALVRWRESTLDIMEGETGRQLTAETVGQGFLFPLAINLAVSDPDGAIHPDTTALARDLVLDLNARSAARDIRTLDDTVKQGHRTVTVTMTGSDHPGVVPDPAWATVTIRVLDDESLPSAPRFLTGTGDEGTVTLEWEASDDRGTPIDRYESRHRVADGSWPASWTPAPGGAGARSVRITGLDPTGRYEFEVRAVNRNGEGPVAGVVAGASVSYGTLTAAFEEYPDPLVHFGEAFRVTLKLSQLVRGERPEMIGRGVRVSGGTARHVEPRHYRPQHVYLEVTPSGSGDVEVVLEPLPCEVAGSLCTSGGNGLAGRQTLSVRGVGSVPGRPSNVRGLRTDDGYVVLFWDLNEEATAYQLRWRRSGAEAWRNESGRPPGPGVHIIRDGPTELAPAELPAEAFGPLERGRDYDVELRWESPRGDGPWLDVSDAVDNLTPPRPQSLTLTQRSPSAVALDWRPGSVSGSTSIAKHQVRLAREPQYLPGGVDLQYPDIRAFRDDGWVDIPDSGHNEANFGGAVLSGTFGGRPLLHVWELKAQVRAVSAAGAVSQASEVALVPETAPEFAGFELLTRPAHGTAWSLGDTLAVALVVSEPVTVTGGTPALALRIGGETREAAFTRVLHPDWAYEGGWVVNSGTRLRFEYAVQAGDATGGIEIPGGEVQLNGAVVRDATLLGAGAVRKRAVLRWATAVLADSAVDAVAPVLERVTWSGNAMTLVYDKELDETSRLYEEAEPFRVRYGTSRVLGRSVSAIEVVGHEVRLTLAPVLRGQVIHRSPLGDESVWVSYSALPNHAHLRLRDTSGNEAPAFEDRWASHVRSSSQHTEGAPLTVAFASLPGRHDGEDAPFTFRVRFSEPVSVGWKAIRDHGFEVTGGRVTRARRVDGRSDHWEMTVAPSTDAEVTVMLPLGRACTQTGAFCTADKRVLANGLLGLVAGPATALTRVTSAVLVTGPGENGTWDAGETVTAEVTFSAAVTVQGAPTLGVTLDGVRREAVHASGDDTQTVRFSYPVTAADAGATQARLVANGFDTSNGIIGDSDGRLAVLDFAVAPWVTAVAVLADASGDGRWSPGEKIEAQLTFSEAVTVTDGTPTVGLTAGGAAKTAPYASGAGTASLVFAYPVTDADGPVTAVTLTADSLALNGASLSASASDLAAELGHDGVEPAAETVLPALPVLSVSDAQATEGAGATLAFSVTLAPAATDTVTVHWATADATATAGTDYTAGSGTLAFAPGETAKTVSVAVLDDTTVETGSGETVTLGLSNASGATIANAAATGTIADDDTAPAAPDGALTAQLTDVPSAHAGPFTFLVSFSEALATGAGRLGAASFAATGATVTGVRKLGEQSHLWEVSVRPRPGEDAQVTLAGGRACDAAGAVCSSEGATLSNSVSATVPSAPMLSVSDARAVEGEDASMTFTVTLAPAAQDTVTVDYATGGGSATAGDDYTGVHGRLRFAPGETSKTIEVAVFDDSYDEGEEIFHLVLYLADGAYIADGAGRGTIVNSDAMPRAWLARFGRTVADQVLDAVSERMEAPRAAGLSVALGGQALPGMDLSGDTAARSAAVSPTETETHEVEGRAKALSDWLNGETGGNGDAARGIGSRTVTGRELALGTAFSLTGETSDGATAGFWGRAAVSGFDGREGELTLDGEVATGLLGADYGHGRWLMGLIASHSRGEGGYRGVGEGTVSSTLTGVHPWARYAVSERLSVWGAAGYGAGTLTLEPEGENQAPMQADLSLALAAAGGRGELVEAPGDAGGPALALVSDAMLVRTESESSKGAGGNLAGAEADVTRLRLAFDGSWRFVLAGDAALTPSLELGMRHDGGDAETGFGVDVGGGLAFAAPKRGLAFDVSARTLVAHEASGFRERGVTAALSFDPLPSTDRGLTMSLRQTLGAASTGGAHALMGRETLAGLGADDDGDTRRLELTAGYGVAMFGGRFTGTPELGLGLSDAGRDYRLGWRLGLGSGGATSFEFGLEATRRESENDDEAEHAVGFRIRAAW